MRSWLSRLPTARVIIPVIDDYHDCFVMPWKDVEHQETTAQKRTCAPWPPNGGKR